MKRNIISKLCISSIATIALANSSASGATISTVSFNNDPTTTVDTTSPLITDWGYYRRTGTSGADFLAGSQPDGTNFDSIQADWNGSSFLITNATNSKATSGIGAVTITERDTAEYTNGETGNWSFVVGAGDGTTESGNTFSTHGFANGIGRGENIYNITLNDLGLGTHIVTLYMTHSAQDRRFNATVDLFSVDGDQNGSLLSATIGGTNSTNFFTFTTEVIATNASDDLSISIDSNSGNFGQFGFGGYTVATLAVPVPEPSSTALFGLGGLALLLRRRR